MKIVNENVTKVCKEILPDLVVLDGLYCMEEDGPVAGKGICVNCAVASTDAIKADGIGVRIMCLNPEDIGYLYYLNKEGLGDYSTNGLIGDKVESCKKEFKMHPTYEVQKRWK